MYCLQLDSATSLIQAAKNLMNAVVLAVKASYVASTKYTRGGINVRIIIHCHQMIKTFTPFNISQILEPYNWTCCLFGVILRPCLLIFSFSDFSQDYY